jgi:hypothetical protein
MTQGFDRKNTVFGKCFGRQPNQASWKEKPNNLSGTKKVKKNLFSHSNFNEKYHNEKQENFNHHCHDCTFVTPLGTKLF